MSARTTTVRSAIAQAGEKGLAHLAHQQNTGTWISMCGRQVRGQDIRVVEGEPAGAHAEQLGSAFCDTCRGLAIDVAGALVDGIAVLLRLGAAGPDKAQLVDVPLTAVHLDPARPSRTADAGLVHSVAEHGVLQPIVLRRTSAGLVLVAGARRLAAAALADLDTIPAVVRELTVDEALIGSLAENLHRADLDPIAQAHAFQRALEQLEVTKEALADRLGISRTQVSNTIRLLGLPEEIQEQVASGRLSAAHGRELLRVADDATQAALAAQIAEEGLSVRETVARRTAGEQMADVAQLLAGILDARVRVSSGAEKARVTIDVDAADLSRVLGRLGLQAA